MDFKEICLKRQSIRNFTSTAISEEKLNYILQMVQTAPSAGNLQAFKVLIIFDTDIKTQLAGSSWHQNFISEAAVVLVFLALPEKSASEYGERGRSLYSIQDATIACTYAMLAAEDTGFSSTWVGAFDTAQVSLVLSLDQNEVPVAILPIGEAKSRPRKTSRRPISKMSEAI